MTAADADERISKLFERHFDEVLAYCTRRIGSGEAADAAADVFAVAWRRIDEIDWETARPWLYGIARNVVSNRWRSMHRRGRLATKLSGVAAVFNDTPEVFVIRREEDREVLDALKRLREPDQEILRLAAWEELSNVEIAAVLDISRAAVEQRLHRAKSRLARALQPGHGPLSPAVEPGGS